MALLRRITEEIHRWSGIENKYFHDENLIMVLNNLNAEERAYIAQQFCNMEWNIGNLGILSILQISRTLTATEYILSQDDTEHIQFVLNDMLEFENDLFSNFLTNCMFNPIHCIKLRSYLEELLTSIITELINNSDNVNVNYLPKIRSNVLEEVYTMFLNYHFNIFLEIENHSINQAFKSYMTWKNCVPEGSMLSKLLSEVTQNSVIIVEKLLNLSQNPNFKGWKCCIIFLDFISKNCSTKTSSAIKKLLKEYSKKFLSKPDKRQCISLLLTSRTICSDTNSNLETYQQWFKNTFGEMKYFVTVEQFKEILNILEYIAQQETDPFYLQIQVNTAISAPPRCNEMVLNYKSLCRQRIARLSSTQESQLTNESIVIDDDDD